MTVNEGFSNMQEARDNLRVIKKCMSLLEANYGKKKEETIRAIQEAGYTFEEIQRIKEMYCGVVTLEFGYKNRDEIKEIAKKLKAINEKIIFGGHRSEEENLIAFYTGSKEPKKTSEVEYVEAEIVSEEEFAEMRRKQEEEKRRKEALRVEKETEDVLKIVNSNYRQRREQIGYVGDRVGSTVGARGAREQNFRQKMADMARESGSTTYRGDRRSGKTSNRYYSQGKTKPGKRAQKKNLKNKPKTLNKFLRRLTAGALAISFIAGAYAVHRSNEYKEDVANRIEYVDDIIDRNGSVGDYQTYCSIEFTDEELSRFLEVEEKIDSFKGRESTDLDGVEIILTAREFKGVYQDIVKERLEEVYGYSIDEDKIEVVRERDDLDGKWGDYNEHGHISKIGYMSYTAIKNIPKELRDSIITAYGEKGIEKPAMTVDQLIYKLDNHEIDKAEASTILGTMLDDVKELMTRQYEEKENGKVKEIDSTYSTIKEIEEEQAKMAGDNKNILTASHIVEDDEMDR